MLFHRAFKGVRGTLISIKSEQYHQLTSFSADLSSKIGSWLLLADFHQGSSFPLFRVSRILYSTCETSNCTNEYCFYNTVEIGRRKVYRNYFTFYKKPEFLQLESSAKGYLKLKDIYY